LAVLYEARHDARSLEHKVQDGSNMTGTE